MSESEESFQLLLEKTVKILRITPEGVLKEDLATQLNASPDQISDIIKKLLEFRCLKITKSPTGSLTYHYQNPEDYKILQSLSSEEEIRVYQLIMDSKNQGIPSNDLKESTDIKAPQLNKILNKLEKRGLIKSTKSINLKNRKIWFHKNAEPSDDITGGIWYTDNEFNKELIDALYSATLDYIQAQGTANKTQLIVALKSLKITNKDLTENNVQSIINLLIFDDKIQEISNKHNPMNPIYKLSNWDLCVKEPEIVNIPCGGCPLFNQCKPQGIISPLNCIYFDEW